MNKSKFSKQEDIEILKLSRTIEWGKWHKIAINYNQDKPSGGCRSEVQIKNRVKCLIRSIKSTDTTWVRIGKVLSELENS